jgi:hypothetical protein
VDLADELPVLVVHAVHAVVAAFDDARLASRASGGRGWRTAASPGP